MKLPRNRATTASPKPPKASKGRLMKRLTLVDAAAEAERGHLDALAVSKAARLFLEQSEDKCQKTEAALCKAQDALFAHNDKRAKAAGGNRVPGEQLEQWLMSIARAAAAVEKALEYCEQSNKRINAMERNAEQASKSRKAKP